jgi:hypothetical protein
MWSKSVYFWRRIMFFVSCSMFMYSLSFWKSNSLCFVLVSIMCLM